MISFPNSFGKFIIAIPVALVSVGLNYPGFPMVNYTIHIVKVPLSLKLQLHPGHFRVLA